MDERAAAGAGARRVRSGRGGEGEALAAALRPAPGGEGGFVVPRVGPCPPGSEAGAAGSGGTWSRPSPRSPPAARPA